MTGYIGLVVFSWFLIDGLVFNRLSLVISAVVLAATTFAVLG